jgi:hypothetical protein
VHTGQHYSTGMSGQLTPDIVLDAHDDRDISRGHQLGDLVTALDHAFAVREPDAVLVQGDTTSALAGALAANTTTPLVHLEAGLRSFDRAMPEEHHRVLIDHLADRCCAAAPIGQCSHRSAELVEGRRGCRWSQPRRDHHRRGSGGQGSDPGRRRPGHHDEPLCGAAGAVPGPVRLTRGATSCQNPAIVPLSSSRSQRGPSTNTHRHGARCRSKQSRCRRIGANTASSCTTPCVPVQRWSRRPAQPVDRASVHDAGDRARRCHYRSRCCCAAARWPQCRGPGGPSGVVSMAPSRSRGEVLAAPAPQYT